MTDILKKCGFSAKWTAQRIYMKLKIWIGWYARSVDFNLRSNRIIWDEMNWPCSCSFSCCTVRLGVCISRFRAWLYSVWFFDIVFFSYPSCHCSDFLFFYLLFLPLDLYPPTPPSPLFPFPPLFFQLSFLHLFMPFSFSSFLSFFIPSLSLSRTLTLLVIQSHSLKFDSDFVPEISLNCKQRCNCILLSKVVAQIIYGYISCNSIYATQFSMY